MDFEQISVEEFEKVYNLALASSLPCYGSGLSHEAPASYPAMRIPHRARLLNGHESYAGKG